MTTKWKVGDLVKRTRYRSQGGVIVGQVVEVYSDGLGVDEGGATPARWFSLEEGTDWYGGPVTRAQPSELRRAADDAFAGTGAEAWQHPKGCKCVTCEVARKEMIAVHAALQAKRDAAFARARSIYNALPEEVRSELRHALVTQCAEGVFVTSRSADFIDADRYR